MKKGFVRNAILMLLTAVVAYVDAWIEDLDLATEKFVEAFDLIANDYLTGAGGKGDIQIVVDRMNSWLDNYGAYCSPMPDFVIKICQLMGKSVEYVLSFLGLDSILRRGRISGTI